MKILAQDDQNYHPKQFKNKKLPNRSAKYTSLRSAKK
jgi:hypothetical protein